MAAAPPVDDLLAEPTRDDNEPEISCFFVEARWAPILSEPSHEGQEVGRLFRGELVNCERVRSQNRNQWVRVAPATEVFLVPRRRRLPGAVDGESQTSGEDEPADGEEDEEGEDAPCSVRKIQEGGYVVNQHCMLGLVLRHVGPALGRARQSSTLGLTDLTEKDIEEVIASTRNIEELEEEPELPKEARIWSREQLETFLVHGSRPRWRQVPDMRDLGLHGSMDQEQIEDVLRTAVEWVSRADALIVACGGGMAADSGLPTLQGGASAQQPWVGLRKLGLRQEEMWGARWFSEDPRLAWSFWLHVCNTYREAEPHKGYTVVHDWLQRPGCGAFVFTSTVDGHWAACGWPVEKLVERHGALHFLQCSVPCCQETWPLPDPLDFKMDPETLRAVGELPCCKRCGAVARPNVELFGGDDAFLGGQVSEQWARYLGWVQGVREDVASERPLVVCLELGCSPGSAGRRFAEQQLAPFGTRARLVRVNPDHKAVAAKWSGRAVAVPLQAAEALMRMDRILGTAAMTSYVVVDAEGQGADILAPSDVSAGHVFRRAWAASPNGEFTAELELRAQSVLNEKQEQPQPFGSPVPANFQVATRDSDVPVVRLVALGVRFGSRNDRMQARLEAVKALLMELLEVYGSPDYQARLEACTDRTMVVNLVRDVHFKVLPNHGISMRTAALARLQGRSCACKPSCSPGTLRRTSTRAWGCLCTCRVTQRSCHCRPEPNVNKDTILCLPVAKNKAGPPPSARAIVLADTKQGAESKWTSNYRPPKVLWIAGTWNKWSPKEMRWDGSQFVEDVTIGKTGCESFQILVMGRWEASLYPSVADGNPFVEHAVLGPDSKGHGRNWTIGRHPRDRMQQEERVSVSVDVDAKGAARKVSWKRVDGQAGRVQPQFTGAQLFGMEEVVGQWRYGTKPNIYEVSRAKDGSLKFEGPHAGGRVSGDLRPEGLWLQGNLLNGGGTLVGAIRLTYLKVDSTMISNFRNASKQDWGKDIAAKRVQEEDAAS